jgi:hypothetical protein
MSHTACQAVHGSLFCLANKTHLSCLACVGITPVVDVCAELETCSTFHSKSGHTIESKLQTTMTSGRITTIVPARGKYCTDGRKSYIYNRNLGTGAVDWRCCYNLTPSA